MIIKLDYRETDLENAINNLQLKVPAYSDIIIKKENLPIGDIIICDNQSKELAIIERKSLADLAASICDGRYAEQSYRLQQCSLHNHAIYYLIEGSLATYRTSKYNKQRITKKTLLSAMTSLSFSKGFSLIKTENINETAEFLLQMTDKLERKSVFYYNKPINTSDSDSTQNIKYSDVASRTKKTNITQDNILNILLLQIPSVSSISASAITTHYKTMSQLINALTIDKNILDSITYITTTGKTRTLSKPVRENIIKYLL